MVGKNGLEMFQELHDVHGRNPQVDTVLRRCHAPVTLWAREHSSFCVVSDRETVTFGAPSRRVQKTGQEWKFFFRLRAIFFLFRFFQKRSEAFWVVVCFLLRAEG